MNKQQHRQRSKVKKNQDKILLQPKKFAVKRYYYPGGLLISILFGIILYSNSFHCSFHFDDYRNIVDNAAIRDLGNVKAWWNFYPTRPVGIFTFALNYHFSQLNVWSYHLVNLVIHLLNTCLVGWLTLLIFSSPAVKDQPIASHKKRIALFVALLFVSHPLATQSVTYIYNGWLPLLHYFYLLSLALYMKVRIFNNGNGFNFWLLAGSFLSAVLALLTKEIAFTLPFAMILVEIFFIRYNLHPSPVPTAIGREGPGMRLLKDYRLILFIAALLCSTIIIPVKLFTNVFKTLPLTLGHAHPLSPLTYLFTQFSVIVKYIQLLFLPLGLRVDYDFPVSDNFFHVRTLFSFLVLSALIAGAVLLYKKHRVLSFGIFWFFLHYQ